MEKVEQNGRIVWQKGNHSQNKYHQSFNKFKFLTPPVYILCSRVTGAGSKQSYASIF